MIIFPALLGSIAAAGKTISTPAPLDIQISDDSGFSWIDSSTNEYYYDYGSGVNKNYLVQALGSGTETLNLSSNNPQFSALFDSNFSNSCSINGGDQVSFTVNFYHTGNPSDYGEISISSSGGDSIGLNISVTYTGD